MADLGAVRKGVDRAGGILITGSNNVFVNKAGSVRLGDIVESHGPIPHSPPPSMVEASPNVYVNKIPICREEDIAACGHPATGSPNVFVNSFEPTSLGTDKDETVTSENGGQIVRETKRKLPGEQ